SSRAIRRSSSRRSTRSSPEPRAGPVNVAGRVGHRRNWLETPSEVPDVAPARAAESVRTGPGDAGACYYARSVRSMRRPVPPARRRHARTAIATEEDVRSYIRDRRNWGRWGRNDQVGALNLVTPAKRVAAARLVRNGRAVSL